jgi:hypothetical protein
MSILTTFMDNPLIFTFVIGVIIGIILSLVYVKLYKPSFFVNSATTTISPLIVPDNFVPTLVSIQDLPPIRSEIDQQDKPVDFSTIDKEFESLDDDETTE